LMYPRTFDILPLDASLASNGAFSSFGEYRVWIIRFAINRSSATAPVARSIYWCLNFEFRRMDRWS